MEQFETLENRQLGDRIISMLIQLGCVQVDIKKRLFENEVGAATPEELPLDCELGRHLNWAGTGTVSVLTTRANDD